MPTTAWYPVKISSGEYVWQERTIVERRNAMRRMVENVAASVNASRRSALADLVARLSWKD